MVVDREFYVFRFGRPWTGWTDGRADGRRADGRTGGRRADGRAGGWAGGRDDFERQYNDFHRCSQKTSNNTVFFCRFASGGSASTDFYSSNEKRVQKTKKTQCFLTFQITRERKCRFLLIKTRSLNTCPDPANPAEMEHELRLATHQQRAGGQDDVSLNKLPQISLPARISRCCRCLEVSREGGA